MVADEDDYEKISSDESDFEADEGDKQQQSEFPSICVLYLALAPSSLLFVFVSDMTTSSSLPRPPPAPTGTVKL